MIRAFLDSGVLIAAYRGTTQEMEVAYEVINGTDRVYLTSPFIRHEVSPKAQYNRRGDEYKFYQSFFRRATFCDDLKAILNLASKEAAKSGVNSMDSLHIAAAHLLRADEFITTERPGKSIYRTSLVNVRYLFQ